MAKRKVKTEHMKLRDRADDLAKAKCRARNRCQAAGLDGHTCKGALQWCHIVERSHLGLRWSQMNCLALCQAAHLFYTYRPFQWLMFIVEHYPNEWQYVQDHKADKFDGDLIALIARLEEE